jgi:hypothetical protein
MKFARGLRQLGLDHILWGHRVVRVECAHRIRIVRDVQKVLDLGNNGGISGLRSAVVSWKFFSKMNWSLPLCSDAASLITLPGTLKVCARAGTADP